MNFKNIIFDLGGVIINLDYHKTIRSFEELGCEGFAGFYTQQKQHRFFSDLETGSITAEEFRDELRRHTGISATDAQIDNAWNALLLDTPQERLDFLAELGKRKRIFLLSNTNGIHKPVFDQTFQAQTGGTLDKYFEKAYYSHLVADRKPNPSIFQMVLDENGLLASETMFIDDSYQHIEAARAMGIHAVWLQAPQTILDLGL